jgi:hypothetical protein
MRYLLHPAWRKKERQKKSKAAKAAAVGAAGTPGPSAGTVAAAVQTKAVAAISEGLENISDDTACGGTEVQMADIIRWAAEAQYSAEEAAVDPAVAGIAATEIAEAMAMQEAAEHYRHHCLDVGLDQLQWWLEEESAEWVVEEERHLRADYIWQISREARLGAEGRVWQQWKAVTGVNTAGQQQ